MDVITKNVSVQGGNRLLKLSLKQGEYLNIGDNIRVVYAGGAGNSPDGRKVRGTIHWVSAADAVKAQVRLYENIIDEEKGVYNEDERLNLNPTSLTVLDNCYVEPSLLKAKKYDSFQFVRNGFFCVDAKDSTPEHPVFNRIVSLKSSYKLPTQA